jgi:flavorubredoxin
MCQPLKIIDNFYWVGARDPHLRTFDIIMETEFGTTYNAYLLKGTTGIAVFETVKEAFFEDYLACLQKLVDPREITHIIVNHTEPDHAGSIVKLLEYAPEAIVVGTALAIKYLKNIMNIPFKSLSVKDESTLSLGDKTLRFLNVPCLHWPDTMYSYIEEDKILVTCDSFGAHYCNESIFENQLSTEQKNDFLNAYRYYFDMIMGPFKPFVQKALNKISTLELEYICPGHGMILSNDNMREYIDLYDKWSTPIHHGPSVVIAYVSAYGYTQQMAKTMESSILDSAYPGEVHLCNLETESLDSVMAKINASQGLLIGSPTILADALPPIWQLLISLNPVLHRSLQVGCFGSYGWSGEALTHMEERIKQLKCPMPLPPLGITFKPSREDITVIEDYAKTFVSTLKI